MMLKRKNCIFVFILAVVASFVFMPAQAAAQDVIWLEAESFDSIGGWVNDPQFVDIMGSPYLLANGVDQPVEDAVTKVSIPEQATYRLWVRTKDWLPSDSPGQFQVFINDTCSAEKFGQSDTADWQWVDGGAFELPAGAAEIRLHDLTGWWGRCDAVVLSADPDFQPSNVVSFLESQRVHYFDPYRDVKTMPGYDVVVVGGGLAGSAAAVEAARQGLSVALIQDRPVLGGNASSEIEVPPGGDNSNIPLDPKETGIIEEFYNVPGRGWEHDWSPAIEKVVRGEENLDLYLNTRAIDAVMKDEQTIKAVIALDVQENQRLLFPGEMFIDCTGDGWLGFWAGAQFRVGREARSEFNETLAPDKNDLKTMGNTLFVAGFKEGDSTPFECPDWAYTQWESREDFESAGTHFSLEQSMFPLPADAQEISSRFTHGSGLAGTQYATPNPSLEATVTFKNMPVTPSHYDNHEKGKGYHPRNEDGGFFQWYVELGGATMDTIYDAEEIRDELFRINLGMWNYVKNHHPEYKEKNKGRRLDWINYVPGKRESRRLIGDYILTQWDYENKIVHEDNVAYGGWGVDVHHPNGYWKAGPMYYSAYRGQQISIPFRALYSKNIQNLLMAGRNTSVSHVALGGVRVMRTTCLMGQAVGAAAAVCLENDLTPREAARQKIREIQQRLMKSGAYIMNAKNEDPEDLALGAQATASSVKEIPELSKMFPRSNTPLVHDLNMQRAVMFKPGKDRIERMALYLRNKNATQTDITLTLRKAEAFRDFSSQEDLAQSSVSVPAKSEGWVEFLLDVEVEANGYYYVYLPPQSGLQWDLFPALKEETCRAYGGPDWTVRDECYAYSLDPAERKADLASNITLEPENVIDGYSRVVDHHPHSWGPAPQEALPQWVQLNFSEPKTFNTVHVSYQNYSYLCPKYDVWVKEGEKWETVAQMEGNTLRRNVHAFDRVTSDAVRLVLKAPAHQKPDDSAQVCEIRVYNEE